MRIPAQGDERRGTPIVQSLPVTAPDAIDIHAHFFPERFLPARILHGTTAKLLRLS